MITIIPCFKESNRFKLAQFFSFSGASQEGKLTTRMTETFGKQEESKKLLGLPLKNWSDGAETKIPDELNQIYRNYCQTSGKQ